jgi:multidrug efflux pump subunit AcrA (membrane-fusion protein)
MRRFSLIAFFLLFGTALFIAACSPLAQPEAQAAPPPPEEAAIPVQVATVQTGPIASVFNYTGNLQAKQTVSMIPGPTGRIESLQVEVGDEVKAGDPIAVIKHDTYDAQLNQAEAALAQAKLNLTKMQQGSRPEQITAAQAAVDLARAAVNDVANVNDNQRTVAATNLADAQAALQKAQAEYDKIAWAGNVGETSQAVDLQQATIAYQSALASYNLDTHHSDSKLAPLMAQLSQAELNLALTVKPYRDTDFQAAQINIQQAQAAVDLARAQLDETTIKAPFDGVVAELYVTQGSTVGPQAAVALFVSKQLEVLVNVEAERISQLSKNQNASLQVSAYPGQMFPAVVTSIAPVADQTSHTFVIKVTPLDKAGVLRSGMYANISILTQEKQNAILAPRVAVTQVNNRPTVYVVKDNQVEQRPVTTGLANDSQIEILTGLKPGETVVIAGQPNLLDGAKVKVVTSGS